MNQTVQHEEYLIETIEGDTFTPISLFQRLVGNKKFLLESSAKHEKAGRFSFIGSNPLFELIGTNEGTSILYSNGSRENFNENPITKLKELIPFKQGMKIGDIPFSGGGIGYVSYDIVRQFEEIGPILLDEIQMPDIYFLFYEVFIVFDHLEQKIHLIGQPLTKDTKLDDLKKKITQLKNEIMTEQIQKEKSNISFSPFTSEISQDEFMKKVETAKKYIQKGDIFQVVLSHRMKAAYEGDPFEYYRKLRIKNPSPYMYFIDFGDAVVVGTSPESLIKVKGNEVVTNPIAGTKPRGLTDDEDLEIEKALLQDEKELAEHKMLVDLGRNDLGKVCQFGSITLEKYMVVEKYKYVMHLVSEVSGMLQESYTALDALISCLPAGTVSGAPKIRAMEIINELEESKRGVYSGAVGYISLNGDIDFALTIRTMLLKKGIAYIQAGAGIVYDSIPEQEFQETLNKLKAFLEETS
ncbi:anthranilate synthase component I [Neobacillus sp. D3-1R]|uniref:anthranilate synthase component I n=1 Tax=Neobacillus sp. D3-1R TaxID=3445778 RepID=UPI003FA01CEB